jgi:hypothetical protein
MCFICRCYYRFLAIYEILLDICCELHVKKTMKTRFLAIHPLIGTKHKPSPLRYQQRSVYYWWWAYLRRNGDYLACCARGGKGKLAGLYADFGDVREDEFRSWWGGKQQRGASLFGEQPSDFVVRKIDGSGDWQRAWDADDTVLTVAVNLTVGRRKLQADFARLLAKEHKGRRGRVAMASVKSTARYPLYRNFSVHSLKMMLAAYDAWAANELLPRDQRKRQWELGESIRLVPNAITTKNDIDAVDKRNTMSAAFNRAVKNARNIIANTARGEFPNSSPPSK